MGYVYAIGNSGGAVKIGWSADPARRLSEINVPFPELYILLGVARGTKEHEAEIHRLFRPYRISGEWFHVTGPVREFIKMLDPTPYQVGKPRKERRRLKPSHDTPVARHLAATGKTDEEFAKEVGSNRTTVLRWRRGETIPSFKTAIRISEITNGAIRVSDFVPKPTA